ncbi:Uncharacterised protein [Mycobacteroides abscessus subsp. abscessus]|nr:Uncharacterised protein [Mycobacteroides abscessus subsp. abscessus]
MGGARVAVLPEGDDHVGARHHRHAAAGQPVEPIGEVDGIGPGHDQDHAEEHEDRGGHGDSGDLTHVGQLRAAWGQPVGVAELQHQNAEYERREDLSDRLGGLVQTQVARLANLDEVIDEADAPEHGRQREHQQTRCRRAIGPERDADQVRPEVTGPHARQDRDTTHRRGAPLLLMMLRAVVANLLAESLP